MEITEQNYRILKVQILFLKKQLERELKKNSNSMKALAKAQDEIGEITKLLDENRKAKELLKGAAEYLTVTDSARCEIIFGNEILEFLIKEMK